MEYYEVLRMKSDIGEVKILVTSKGQDYKNYEINGG
jgi:hypothetical protein